MSSNKRQSDRVRRRMNIFVPTASMGDIAFLLIIFFMLTSKFMQESHVVYKEAESPDVTNVKDTPFSVIVDEDGAIWLQGQQVASPEELRLGIEALIGDKKDAVVMLRVDMNLNASKYVPVAMSLGKAGVQIAMIGSKSKSY